MISRDEMKDFIHPIVAGIMPDELLAFELEGDSIISDLYDDTPVHPVTIGKTDYEFLDSAAAQMVLEFVKLLTATLGLIKVLSEVSNKHETSEKELARLWTDKMKSAGLSEKKAAKITQQFVADLAKRMGKNQ
jgi:hypothetical protein